MSMIASGGPEFLPFIAIVLLTPLAIGILLILFVKRMPWLGLVSGIPSLIVGLFALLGLIDAVRPPREWGILIPLGVICMLLLSFGVTCIHLWFRFSRR